MIIRKKATVTTIQGKKTSLQLEDGQSFDLSSEDGGSYQVNDQVVITILPADEAILEQQALAREILNQLLAEEKL